MRIVSWNINSIRLRLPLLDILAEELSPNVICLQECKAQDHHFPHDAIIKTGFEHMVYYGMKSYNGVAICSKYPIVDHGRMDWAGKSGDARHIWADIEPSSQKEPIRIHNVYIPAGGDIADALENPKFAHKLQFVSELANWSKEQQQTDLKQVILGDFNIAPSEHDVWSHKQLLKIVSHTPKEVELLAKLQSQGHWIDAIREAFPEPEKLYSWWSYRAKDWQKSARGRRLDHIWISKNLQSQLVGAGIHTKGRSWEKPSDHCPIWIDL